jgi:hypothetical protein
MKTLLLFMLFAVPAVAQQETEALSAMRLGCNKHSVALGCYNYANMLVREEQPEEAEKYFERGCKLKHEGSCEKQKWDIPDRVKTTNQETTSPSPASVSTEEEIIEPESADLNLEVSPDINQ